MTSKGQLNKLIDSLLHPLFKKHPGFVILDGILHALVEQNPEESLHKFIKYNLDKLVKYTVRWFERGKTRSNRRIA